MEVMQVLVLPSPRLDWINHDQSMIRGGYCWLVGALLHRVYRLLQGVGYARVHGVWSFRLR